MRKLSTAERRKRVAKIVADDSLPAAKRSARALGKRFGVSHRTILKDLRAAGVAPVGKQPAGGISKEDRQLFVREHYAAMTCEEIALELGCSVSPIKDDIHELGLEVRKQAPRRKSPEPTPQDCECGCGKIARPGGKFVDREHYRVAKRLDVLELAGLAGPLWNDGLTLDEIEVKTGAPRYRIAYALAEARDDNDYAMEISQRHRGKQKGRDLHMAEVGCAVCNAPISLFPSQVDAARRHFCTKHWKLWRRALSQAYWSVRGISTANPFAPELLEAFKRALAVGRSFEEQARQSWPTTRGRRPPLALDLAIEAMHVWVGASDDLVELLIRRLLADGDVVAPGLSRSHGIHSGYVKQRRKIAGIKRPRAA